MPFQALILRALCTEFTQGSSWKSLNIKILFSRNNRHVDNRCNSPFTTSQRACKKMVIAVLRIMRGHITGTPDHVLLIWIAACHCSLIFCKAGVALNE